MLDEAFPKASWNGEGYVGVDLFGPICVFAFDEGSDRLWKFERAGPIDL